ncbi:MAG: prephenate dehydrogenase/arogenate dehydrogenase family protein [Pirellulaceae bacterium]
MPAWNTVAIIGVGLIGGSIGLGLRRRGLARRVVGIGRRASSLRKAKQHETVDATTTSIAKGVADAELIIVGTPVSTIVDMVVQAASHAPAEAIITDAGSTKSHILHQLRERLGAGRPFIGSHPLAGSEKSGPEFASEDLFEGRLTVVTPTRQSDPEKVARVEAFWESLGSRVVRMTPEAHDAAVAEISHMPHLIASALAAATSEKHLPLAATGWRDTTRVAAGEVELWRQIVGENRAGVLKSLDKFEKVLSKLRAAVERGDDTRLVEILEAGKRIRDAVGS